MNGRFTPIAIVGLALTLASANAAAQSLDDRYRVAAGHYRAERWELAVEELSALLELDATYGDGAGQYFLGEALLQLMRRDDAVAAYRACRDSTMTADFQRRAAFRIAEAAILDRRFAVALDELTRFRDTHGDTPLDAYALPYLGEAQLECSQPKLAEETFRSALDRYPAGPLVDACRLGVARAADRQGRRDDAISEYKKIADSNAANRIDALLLLGALQLEASQFAEARESFRRLLDEHSQHRLAGQAAVGLGQALVQLGEAVAAIAGLAHWLDDKQVGRDATYWTALADKSAERWADAADLLERLIADCDDGGDAPKWLPAAYLHAGEARLHGGQLDQAAERLSALVARWPAGSESAVALGHLAHIAQQTGDHAQAAKSAAKLREQHPEATVAWEQARRAWAASLIAEKRYAEAAELMAPAFDDDAHEPAPADERLWALALEGAGRHQEALASVARLEAAGEATFDLLLVEAAARRALREFETAAEILAVLCEETVEDSARRRALSQAVLCHVELGNLDVARQQLDQLCADRAVDALAVRPIEALADALSSDDAFADAAGLYDRLSQDGLSDDVRRRALLRRAWCLIRSGSPETALRPLGDAEAIVDGPSLVEMLSLRASALECLERWDAALATYERIARECADSPRADELARRQAQLLVRRSLPGEAATILARLAIRTPPPANIDAITYEWAWAEHRRGDEAKAIDLFRRVWSDHSTSPYWPDAAYRAAEADVANKQYDSAAGIIDQLVASDHGGLLRLLPHALLLQAKIAIEQERWREALSPLAKLLNDHPTSDVAAAARFWQAEALYRLGETDMAREAFERVARDAESSDPPPTWTGVTQLRRAEICAQRQDWAAALELASPIADRFPGFSHQFEADYVVGRAHAAGARFDAAREAYRRVVQSESGRATETAAMAQWMIGESYMHQRDFAAALREYLKVEILYDYPEWQAAALLQAGKCSESLDDARGAKQSYSRLLTEYADTKFVGEARDRLTSLEASQPRDAQSASRRPADTGARK